jgi:hypothetical protein
MDCDLSTLIGVMEEVVKMTGINKKHSPSDKKDYTPRTELPRKLESKPAEPIKKEKAPMCWNCGETGHRSTECTKPRRKINNVHASPDSDSESNFDIIQHEYSDTHYGQADDDSESSCNAILVINADIGNEFSINAIHGESNLPQKWEDNMYIGHISGAKLLNNKPEEGRCYTLRKTSYTKVIFRNLAVKILLDIGAFCSCTSATLLQQIYPEWRKNLGGWKNDYLFLDKQLPNRVNVNWTVCGPAVDVKGVVFPIPFGKWESGR